MEWGRIKERGRGEGRGKSGAGLDLRGQTGEETERDGCRDGCFIASLHKERRWRWTSP